MSVVSLTSALVLVSSLATYFAVRDYQRRRGIPYPPGPRRLPLIGNLLDIPKEFPWLSFTRLSETHGMIYFHSNASETPDGKDGRGCLIFPCLW